MKSLPPSSGGACGNETTSPPAEEELCPFEECEEEIILVEVENRLCGEYAFKRTGNAMTVNVTGLGGTFFHTTTGELFNIEFGINCVTITNVYNSSTASDIFNTAWNTAVIDIQSRLNSNALAPNYASIYAALIEEVGVRLGLQRFNSTFINGICPGSNINATAAQYCN